MGSEPLAQVDKDPVVAQGFFEGAFVVCREIQLPEDGPGEAGLPHVLGNNHFRVPISMVHIMVF